ncbi:hypothetical protein ACJ41O_014984 [Fusarium nematophilum]
MATSFAKADASQIAIGARSDLPAASSSILEAALKAGREPPTILTLNMDVADPSSVDASAAKVRSEFGRLDIVINNAGILTGSGKIADSDPEGWMRNFDVNSKGFYLVLRAFIPLLIDSDAFADTPELAGDSVVYLTSEKRDWLAGRYINAMWDLPELMGKKEWIVAEDKLKAKLSV